MAWGFLQKLPQWAFISLGFKSHVLSRPGKGQSRECLPPSLSLGQAELPPCLHPERSLAY